MQYKTTSAPDRAGVSGDSYSGWVDAGNSGTSTDVEITGLTNGVSYDVRIAASNGKGDGPWIAAASATPHEDVTWSAILTVDDHVNGGFFVCIINIIDESHDRMAHCSVAMTGDEFAYEGKTYRFIHFLYNKIWDSYTVLLVPSVPAKSALLSADLHIGSDTYALDDRDTVEWNSNNGGVHIDLSEDVGWSKGQKVPLFLGASTPKSSDATVSTLTVASGAITCPSPPPSLRTPPTTRPVSTTPLAV